MCFRRHLRLHMLQDTAQQRAPKTSLLGETEAEKEQSERFSTIASGRHVVSVRGKIRHIFLQYNY